MSRCWRTSITARASIAGKLGYLKATVEFALRHPEVAQQFDAYLKAFLASRRPAPEAEPEPKAEPKDEPPLNETPELAVDA